jgi:transposase-like protein
LKKKDTSEQSVEQSEVGLSLEELIRCGAPVLIQKAIEVEVQQLLADYEYVRMLGGSRTVVRNDYLSAREVLTAGGNIEGWVPKMRARSGSWMKFNSALVPPYVRRSARVSAALPWLYLKGIWTGDIREALTVLHGDEAKGPSATEVSRLKAEWATEYASGIKRDLAGGRYGYWWSDGGHASLRGEEDARQCLRVIIGVRLDGTKDPVVIGDGLRASKTCWLELLRDQKVRGLDIGPCRVVGSGALGFWATLDEIDPETRRQRCWGHKAANVLNALPRSVKVKAQLLEIWMAPTRAQAVTAVERFVQRYQAKYPKTADREQERRAA